MSRTDVERARAQSRWSLALRGVIGILIGLTIIVRPVQSVQALALVLAVWALIEGVATTLSGIGLRSVVGHWWVILLGGVVSVLIGVLDLAYTPGLTLKLLIILTRWWLIISGVIGIYLALQERKAGLSWGWTMAWSLLAGFAGVVIFVNPGQSLLALMRVLAVFGIVGGLFRLALALQGPHSHADIQRVTRHPLRM